MYDISKLSKKDENLLFQYGLFILFFNIFTLLIVLIIGSIFNELFFTILLMLLYIPVRIIIGGYHCKKATTCLITFSLIIICIILSYKVNVKSTLFWLSIPLYFLTIYFIIRNKPTKKINCAMIFFTIEFILCFSNNIFSSASYYSIIMISSLYLVDIIIKKQNPLFI